jgi:UDP-N-acetylenolpyruvoylglucosamine reductase
MVNESARLGRGHLGGAAQPRHPNVLINMGTATVQTMSVS